MKPQLSIIFVNWNSVSYLRACLATLYNHTKDVAFEAIVVDNDSPQAGVESLNEEFPDVRILKSPVNLGFAGANNLGFKNSRGDYLLFLNPDTELTSPVLLLLLKRLKAIPDAGIIGCKLLNTDLTIQTSCIQTFPTILNQLLDIEALRLMWPGCGLWNIAPLFSKDPSPKPVEVISGACMLMKRETFERAGMFTEDYFMYTEDIDLCYKVIQLGLKNYYVGEAEIIHHGGKSSSQAKVNQWSTFMKLRAVQKFCAKTRGRFYGFLYKFAMGFAALGRLMLLGLMRLPNLILRKQSSHQYAWSKWGAILRWSVGLDKAALKATATR